MFSITTKSHVGADGLLTVQVPTPLRNADVEISVVVQASSAPKHSPVDGTTPESLGWPPGFFERTFGSLRDDPLERLPQGEHEQREAFE